MVCAKNYARPVFPVFQEKFKNFCRKKGVLYPEKRPLCSQGKKSFVSTEKRLLCLLRNNVLSP